MVRADVLTDDRGRSKGCGTVVFEHVSEAQNAAGISLVLSNLFTGETIFNKEKTLV